VARTVIPGLPHPVTQRGNRRQDIFFEDGDHEIYLDLLAEQKLKWNLLGRKIACRAPDHRPTTEILTTDQSELL
jgi:putative transposase